MFRNAASVLACAVLMVSTTNAHGIITSPPVRAVGPAMNAACGASVAALVIADNTSHIEGMPEAAAAIAKFNSTACNVFLCKGLQFADNADNVQTFQPGQVVNMLASIPIPHEGPMNVSIINTKTNLAIGKPLIEFDSYADESLPQLPANNTNFNFTIPEDLGTNCTVAGTCVLQWFWFGTAADQTYESCVDMIVPAANAASSVSNSIVNGTASLKPTRGGVARRSRVSKLFRRMHV